MSEKPVQWHIYILQCNDNSFYTGITTDLKRRLDEHNSSKIGARYTRTRRPVTLVYTEAMTDRSMASQREYAIKKLSRCDKMALISSQQT